MSRSTERRQLPSVLSAVMMLFGAGIATGVVVLGTGLSRVAAAGVVGSLLVAVGGYALYTRHVVGLTIGTAAVIGGALAFLAIGLPVIQHRQLLTIIAGGALVGGWYAVGLLASGCASLTALRRVRRALVRSVVVLWIAAGALALLASGDVRAASRAVLQASGDAFQGLITTPLVAPPFVLLGVLITVLAAASFLRKLVALNLMSEKHVPSAALNLSAKALGLLLVVTGLLSLLMAGSTDFHPALQKTLAIYEQTLVAVCSAPVLLASVIALVVTVWLCRLGISVVEQVRAARLATTGRSVMRILPAVGILVVILVATPRGLLLARLQTVPMLFRYVPTIGLEAFLLGAVGAALVPLLATLVAVRLLRLVSLVPDPRAFAGIASAGFVTAVIVAATSLPQTALVAVGIGGALLIWDSAEFGVQLARDLDTRLSVTPNEFVHHGMSLAAAGVAAALVIVVTGLTRPVATLLRTAAVAESTLGQSPLVIGLLLGGVVLLLLGFNAARPT